MSLLINCRLVAQAKSFIFFVGAFEDPDIIHVDDSVDPVRDLEVISEELRLKVFILLIFIEVQYVLCSRSYYMYALSTTFDKHVKCSHYFGLRKTSGLDPTYRCGHT